LKIYADMENDILVITYVFDDSEVRVGSVINSVPVDKMFREAWGIQGDSIIEDITKSKTIAHDIRRKRRDEEFAPLDRLATVPSQFEAVETQRVLMRAKYDLMQVQIDTALTIEELKEALA
jgi:hypothetical protein